MATYESRKAGPNEFSFVGYPIQVAKVAYEVADLDASDNFFAPIEAGVAVVGVAHRVVSPFVGGTPTIDLGDSGSTNYFLATTQLTVGTTNAFGATFAKGKFYAAANYVKVTGSTELTSGSGEIFIFFVDSKTNWRTENDLS